MSQLSPFSRKRRATSSHIALALFAGVLAAGPAAAGAQDRIQAPDSLTDAEFWRFFTTMSEADGFFLSENFVSNELSFQDVIPTLQKSLTSHGVYLGVGPEQNFTYIANLGPRMAVIFDIRRQNAMQHLMYKALFEMSPTRAEFIAKLFSRPTVATLPSELGVKALFDSAQVALPNDSAYKANFAAIISQLTTKHGFRLPKEDIATIEHVFDVFFAAGPEVNYGYRAGNPASVRSTYPTFAMLQSATNADSIETAFLGTEANYQVVREMQLRNLIVPVVGNFGGPSAIRSVGRWLRDREMTVTAFYVSNVEQYLFRETGLAEAFYANVSALPIDTTSSFIRSVPRAPGTGPMMFGTTGFNRGIIQPGITSVIVTRDASGRTVTQTFRDSAGVTVSQTAIDSTRRDSLGVTSARDSMILILRDSLRSGRAVTFVVPKDSITRDTSWATTLKARRDSIARANSWQVAVPNMAVVMGGLLTSGIASMKLTVDKYFFGELKTYEAVINMTKVSGWR